jgi:hypothetical protein
MRIFSVTGTFTALTVASMIGGGERDLPHQSGAGVAVHHLLDRAAHVDVDDRGAPVLVELGGFRHLDRRAAGELHRDRVLDRVPAAFWSDWRVSRIIAWLAIISVTVRPAP